MSKKIKIVILVIAIIAVLGIATIPVLKWYNNQEHIIVSKAFGVTITKDADIIYFDDDDDYLHAAYGVSEEDFDALRDEIKAAGYQEMNFDRNSIDFEWIPSDRVEIMHRLTVDSGKKQDIYITEHNNGFVELYFVK